MGSDDRPNPKDNGEGALVQLRALVPRRPLRYAESLRIAELQAERLLMLAEIEEAPVPVDFIGQLPRIEVVFADDSPVAGSAHWDGHDWIIVINARKRATTRRYSLAHEFKHVVDHTTHSHLYTGMPRMTPAQQAEQAADFFAGCLLMPSDRLREAARDGLRTTAQFASRFGVPMKVAERRLHQVGLAPDKAQQIHLRLEDRSPGSTLDPDATIGADA